MNTSGVQNDNISYDIVRRLVNQQGAHRPTLITAEQNKR